MNINIKKSLSIVAFAACFAVTAMGQDNTKITGKVVDQQGEAIAGANVGVKGSTIATITDADGIYNITVPADSKLVFSYLGYKDQTVEMGESETLNVTLETENLSKFEKQTITIGAFKDLEQRETTSAVAVIGQDLLDNRSAKNIGNSLLGLGYGMITLDGTGMNDKVKEPTFYVRGLQTVNTYVGSSPLIVVDGVERDITTLVPSDVEEVQILKDAAAVALFGYKGSNNVIYIKTKRGQYNMGTSIRVSADNTFKFQKDRPEFVDAATWARAKNEGLANEGSTAAYSDQDIAAYESGEYPYLFPNVNWVDETFDDVSTMQRYNVDFTGGGKLFRYYTSLNLLSDRGFIAHADDNEGYSTQDKYCRANLRSNLDVRLTDYTDMQVNLSAVISEQQSPGADDDIWGAVYSVPSLAYPVKTESGDWGGTSTWLGTSNPVALSSGAGYYKYHERALFFDLALDQSLEMFVEGLKVHGRVAYDNFSTLYEDHSRTYVYGKQLTSGWDSDGNPILGDYYSDGESTSLGDGANTTTWTRRANALAGVSYDRDITDNQHIFAQLRWDYDFENTTGVNTTLHRHNFSFYTHYGILDKYFVDVTLVGSGSNRLAPDHKWSFSPTVAAAWVLSEENFLKNSSFINFMKLRASFGIINNDWLPEDTWTYYTSDYSSDSAYYPLGNDYSYGDNARRVSVNRMATDDPTNEKAQKLNVGLDMRFFDGLDLQLDYFLQHNVDGWVEGNGVYTSVIGFEAPYVNDGEARSYGIEVAADYNKRFGDFQFNLGGSFSFNRSKILDMAEETRAYDNLVQTGDPISSNYGYIALGLFKDQAEIDAAPTQNLTTTVRPGDIRYEDVNGDDVIDANDICKIGYGSYAPEIYYTFHLGAEYKGIGLKAGFQGVGNYTANLSTTGYYWCYADNNLSQEVYDNRWTSENLDAKYPRLSATANANNYVTSTFWQRNRSYFKLRNVELYYDFKNLLANNNVLHDARVYVRGVDLFTIDHIDGHDAASYGATAPLNANFVCGLSLTF